MPTETFGSLVRSERVRVGYTQARLAAISGLAPNTIEAIENGTRTDPHISTVAAIARALGVGFIRLIPVATRGHAGRGSQHLRRFDPEQPDGIRLRELWGDGSRPRQPIYEALGIGRATLGAAVRQQNLPRYAPPVARGRGKSKTLRTA